MNLKDTIIREAIVFIVFMLVSIGLAANGMGAEEDYNGVYAGTFSGEDHGVWVVVIDSSSDNIFLSHSTDTGDGDGGYLYFEEYEDTGNVWGWLKLSGNYADAYIDLSNDSVSGFWDGSTESSGTLSGNAVTSCTYEGSYSGTFQGDLSGTWAITIYADGSVIGSMISEGGTLSLVGGCHPDGYVIVFSRDGYGYYFAGSGIIDSGGFSGQWASESGDAGTFSSDFDDDDTEDDADSGDGSSGCFISQLF